MADSACVTIGGQSEQALGIGEDDGRQSDVEHADFDELLQSNVLDTLADFEFSCGDLSALEPDAKAVCSSGGIRRRTFAASQTNALLTGAWEPTSGAYSHAEQQPSAQPISHAAQQQQPRHNSSLADLVMGAGMECETTSAGGGRGGHESSDLMIIQQSQQQQEHHKPSLVCGGGSPSSGDPSQRSSSPVFCGHGAQLDKVPPGVAVAASAAAVGRDDGNSSSTQPQFNGVLRGKKRKSPGMGGGGKRALNPERMERKATREKRRREEVNEKFEQLLTVLEEAEATSGLEPPAPEDGQHANACINGRRVEVLHRTISVLRKLLHDRRQRTHHLVNAPAPICFEQPSSLKKQPPNPSPSPPSFCDGHGHNAIAAAIPPSDVATPQRPAGGASSEASPSVTTSGLTSSRSSESITLPEPTAQGHVVVPVQPPHGGHPHAHSTSMPVPTGFAMAYHPGMPMPPGAVSIPAGATGHMAAAAAAGVTGMHPNMQGRHAQPFFIAVPMFMPPGQGMGGTGSAASAEASGESAPPVAPVAPMPAVPSPVPPPAAAVTVAAQPSAASTSILAADEKSPCEGKAGFVGALTPMAGVPDVSTNVTLGKPSWPMPGGVGFPPMMLQMPQFVTQALTAQDGDEKVTHAMCA